MASISDKTRINRFRKVQIGTQIPIFVRKAEVAGEEKRFGWLSYKANQGAVFKRP